MSPERWQKIEDVFQAVVDLAPAERLSYLNENYADDPELIAEIQRLIADYEEAGDFIESPVWTDSFMLGKSFRNQIGDALNEEIRQEDNGSSMIGKRLGVYRLTMELGRGGMGAVYLAERADGEFRQRVALKVIKRGMDTDFIVRRFRNERQILASLDHPNIARLLDGGTTQDGLPFFVMEYIEGKPVYRYSDAEKLTISERLQLFRRICAAVDYAHRNLIIHRDIKPSNIMITASGMPKLLDFGIAKILNPELAADSIDPTATAMRMMTPEYASPEQVRGEAVTKASDIYSLGVLLYELLTGHRPYRLKNRALHEIARVICEEEPENLGASLTSEENIVPTDGEGEPATLEFIFQNRNSNRDSLRRELSGDLEKIVRKALRKEPRERYQSAAELADDILRYLEHRPVRAETFYTAPAPAPKAIAQRNPDEISVAVLPLKLFGSPTREETGDDYLCIGLADALITRLSNIRRFVIRPTSSVLRYGNTDSEPITAGAELGVNYVVDGNIRRVGTKLRVTIQLLNINEGAARWAAKFDEEFTDVLSLEDLISEKVAEALVPQLTGDEREKLKKRGTNNSEAFEHYLRGRHYWNTFTEDGFAKALVAYYQAIAHDPNYALAYAGVADYCNWLAVYGVLPSRECFKAATDNAKKALELDPHLAEAHASLAFALHGGNFDWEMSEKYFQKALELNPNSPNTHVWYSIMLTTEGRFTAGLEHAARAVELDSQTPFNSHNLGWCLYFARQYDKSLEQYRRAVEQHPRYPLAHYGLAWVLRYLERNEEALQAADRARELMSESVFSLHVQGQTFASAGMREETEAILEKLEERGKKQFVSTYHTALIYAFLNEKEKAFELLEKGLEISEAWLVWLGVEPAFDNLRSDARFERILEKTGNPVLRRQREAKAAKTEPVLAVLPFKLMNLEDDKNTEDKFLGLGLADALITRLSNVRRFTVRPTSSVLQFGAESNPFEAGRELKVDFIVDGNIRRIGDRIRVTVQLLQTDEGATRWARRFDEKVTDVLTLEDSISEQIAESLVSQLSGEEQQQISKRGTNNREAYEAYLRGRYYWNQFTPESLPKAFDALKTAVELDPGYALAHVGLADFYIWANIYGLMPSSVAVPEAERAARRALEIDESLGEAYASIGLIHSNRREWTESERLYRRALDLNPNYVHAHEWLAALLVGTGRTTEGIEEIIVTERLDPLSPRTKTLAAWTLYQAGRFSDALERGRQIVDLDKNYPQGHSQIALNLLALGEAAEAVEVFRQFAAMIPQSALAKYQLCFALARAGRRDEARGVLEETLKLAETTYVKPYFLAMEYIALGDYERAVSYFEKAIEENDPWLLWFETEPMLGEFRQDPRYFKLLRRMNSPAALTPRAAEGEKGAAQPATNGEKSIAVLPLVILDVVKEGSTEEEFLGIGLADALITRLSSVKRLVVRPTSSVLRFDKMLPDPFEAAQTLDVGFILSGHVKRAGDRIRVSVQMLDVAQRKAVWAGRFDEKFTDVLELEDSISEQIVGALIPHLTDEDRRQLAKRGTSDPKAYEVYLRGRYFWNKFTGEHLLKAVGLFQEAIRLDPDYALPHVGLADFYNWTAIFGLRPSHECFPQAKRAALRALEIDDSLGEAYASLAFATLLYDWNWVEAERLVKRALELSPNHPFAHECYSNFLASQGLFDEAAREIERAEELEPVSARALLMSSWTYYQARRFPQAAAKAFSGLEMEKNPQGLLHYGNALIETGQLDEAIEKLRESSRLWRESKMPDYMLCFALARAGREREAREVLQNLLETAAVRHVKPFFIAMAYVAVGERDAAFAWFEKSLEARDEWLIWFGTEPKLDSLRGDPRYSEMFRRTNNPMTLSEAVKSLPEPTSGEEKSIAVLPLKILNTATGSLNDDDFLGLGLADALITRLSSVKRLSVRPTSSVIRFGKTLTDPFVAAAEIDVKFVVDGHVKRAGDRIRVSIQLLNVAEQTAVWAKSFDEKFTDVLELEDSISEQVARALIPQLTEDEKQNLSKRPTDNPDAFEAYLRGRYHWNSFTREGLQKALACYEQAISYDPNYALAYAGIADYFNWLSVYALMPSVEASAKAMEVANRAIQIDDKLAAGYAALGFATLIHDLDWQAAEKHLLKAIELGPNYVLGRIWYSYFLGMQRRFDEAFSQINQALKLDPLAPLVSQTHNWMLYYGGQLEESIAASYRLIEREPNYGLSFLFFSSVLAHVGEFEEAVKMGTRSVELLGRSPYTLSWLASVYAAAGDVEKTGELLDEIEILAKSHYASPYLLAMVHINLGDKETAYELLEKAAETRDARIAWLFVDPRFNSLRDEARFQELLLKTKNPAAIKAK